jgi:hypothetical protein
MVFPLFALLAHVCAVRVAARRRWASTANMP